MMALSVAQLPWLEDAPANFSQLCKDAERAGAGNGAGQTLRRLAEYRLNGRQSLVFSRALSRVRSGGGDIYPLSQFKLALLSNGTSDLIADCLAAGCARHGVAVELVVPAYDSVMQEALDTSSQTHLAKPDAVLVAVDHHWIAGDVLDLDTNPQNRVESSIARLRSVITSFRDASGTPTIIQTIPVPATPLFGNMDRRVESTPRWFFLTLNAALTKLAEETGAYLLDVAALAEQVGGDQWFSPAEWLQYKIPFSSACAPIYADHVGRLLGAIRGKSRKCLVLDLDNTLWGGVIGDDGLNGIKIGQGHAAGEAHLQLQKVAAGLRDRGIFLAVCSKNDDATARIPFRDHPEMHLRERHISVFMANWSGKPGNIAAIAKTLNIGIDSLVFFDDNPAERAEVRATLPEVAVPELPADPSVYPWILLAAGYFEAVNYSSEDRHRAVFAAADALREDARSHVGNVGDYLSSLEMVATLQPFDETGRPRITQLINKTNQFNLTTRRHTEAAVAAFSADPRAFTLQVRLRDKFGDLGMIGVVIAVPDGDGDKTWDIDTWLMSCRVLGRKIEAAMLQAVVAAARARGIARLRGKFIPTPKNGMVAEHYSKLKFRPAGETDDGTTKWELDVTGFEPELLPMSIVDQALPESVTGAAVNALEELPK